MNIFFLHILPALCALYHCDKHVVKMIIETAQILSAAHWLTPDNPHTPPYRLVRNPNNKPMNWARETIGNYRWLVELGLKLCEEYTHRYGKVHASQKILEWMRDNEPALPNMPMTTFPPAIPEGYIVKDEDGEFDTVESYRKYYVFDKRYFAKWTKRDVPEWYTEGVANLTADEIAKTDQAAADYKQKNADRRKRKLEREAKAKAEADANKENKKNEESDADEDERPSKKVKKTVKSSTLKKSKKKIIIETDEEDEEAEGSGDEYTLKKKLVMTTVTLATVTSSVATSSTTTTSAVRAYPLRERRLVYSRAVKVM